MKKLLLLLTLLYGSMASGQYYNQRSSFLKANSQWILGTHGINFSSTSPQVYPTSLDPAILVNWDWPVPIATASDPANGSLRFFATCRNAYDKNYHPMPDGNFTGNASVPQGVCIVPFPGDPDRYYVFVLHFNTPTEQDLVSYSVVDMQRNNGLGDVVPGSKNTSLLRAGADDPYVKTMIAIPGNDCDIWLVVQTLGALRFHSYHITPLGIDPDPVISVTDSIVPYSTANWINYNGPQYLPLQVSPDRKTIAGIMPDWNYPNARSATDRYFLFLNAFDPETGVIAPRQYILQAGLQELFAACFTPGGKKLVTCYRDSNYLAFNQYDIPADTGLITAGSLLGSVPMHYSSQGAFGYWPIAATMRLYAGNIYFNHSKDSIGPIGNSNTPVNFMEANCGLGMIVHADRQPDPDDATHGIVPMAIPLTMWSTDLFQPEVVYPFTPGDTLTNTYIDTLMCNDATGQFPGLELAARPGFTGYSWNDGREGRERSFDQAGTYWVFYKGTCNTRVDTFRIRTRPMPAFLPPDTTVCDQRFPFRLEPYTAGDDYRWSDSSHEAHMIVPAPGHYWLSTVFDGCAVTDSIDISRRSCSCQAAMPGAFSPNGDGINDYFKPVLAPGCVPSSYSFYIYDRWGRTVYTSFSEYDPGWNGMDKGLPANAGTYFFMFRFKSAALKDDYIQKGDLVLIR